MEENKVLIDLSRYNELLIAEYERELVLSHAFGGSRLSYNKEDLSFDINNDFMKNLFPVRYAERFKALCEEEKNV